MEGIQDSNVLNFKDSIDAIQRKLTTPKKRGVRGSNVTGDDELQDNLRKDILAIVTSPLSQIGKVELVPGLNAAQIEALRSLYTLVKDGQCPEKDLQARVEVAVKALDPSRMPEIEEEQAEGEEGHAETGTILAGPVRRSARLALLQQALYREEEEFDELLDDGEDQDFDMNLDEDEHDGDGDGDGDGERMDSVEAT